MRASISKIRLFKSCRRAYELRYIEGLTPIVASDALEIGRSYHSKLEELYKNGAVDTSDFSKASAMACAYQKYIYPKIHADAVEESFEMNICPEHTITGRVDGIVDGKVLIEHKTTSNDLDAYEFDLEWDEQLPCYMLAYGIKTMIYTLVKKPTIRLKKDESEEEFFHRMVAWYDDDTYSKIRFITVTRTDDELTDFRKHLIMMCDEMERAEASGRLYKNPAYCHHWNTLCEYAQICNNYDPNETYINFERSK